MYRSARRTRPGTFPALSPLAFLLTAGLSALGTPVALAQVAATAPEQAGADSVEKREVLDTVTVSATRRREPVREVPLRVETLSAARLERQGAASLSETVGALPGVDVKTGGGPGLGAITMRGVSVGEQGGRRLK